jgi:hypothetical protein
MHDNTALLISAMFCLTLAYICVLIVIGIDGWLFALLAMFLTSIAFKRSDIIDRFAMPVRR